MRRVNQYLLIKDGKNLIINAHKGKSNISLVGANQAKKLINSRRKNVSPFLIENHLGNESIKANASLKGCTKERKL